MSKTANSVRIIAGKWRGRRIHFPDVLHLRPTHDRIRETLFNWLSPYIAEANCLDCFAGSGALGFEALSRGAKFVTFVDQSPDVINTLRQNASLLTTTQCEMIQAQLPKPPVLSSNRVYDIIFLDPPYRQNLLAPTCAWLDSSGLLTNDALIYVESEIGFTTSLILTNCNWQPIKEKHTSSIYYALWSRCLF